MCVHRLRDALCSTTMAGPAAAAMPQRRPQQRGQQPKGGLAGPELQLVEERLLELQFGLLSLHDDDEVRMHVCIGRDLLAAGCRLNPILFGFSRVIHKKAATGGGQGRRGATGGMRGVVPAAALRGRGGGARLLGTFLPLRVMDRMVIAVLCLRSRLT